MVRRRRSEDSVKVAVRVRPFNEREITRNAKLIIQMQNNTTYIQNPDEPGSEPRKFTFDYSYWSHDGFITDPNGYLRDDGNGKYADQGKVFDDLGRGVLANAWKGYNCSLFAYGQTGSGKSYSVVGYEANKGIIPLFCDTIYKEIRAKEASPEYNKEQDDFNVQLSMIEIYNEQVKDLLNLKTYKKGGLRVRQSKDGGFQVESLRMADVSSYAEIDALIQEGTKARTIASTNMNLTSSRAHTVVTIYFKQKTWSSVANKSMTKTSQVSLVDLAGSERAESTGATGARLKEGAAINLSLSTLGNCIKALADQSNPKNANKRILVPYRDSKLTMLLKNALGGNSKTMMIAALSPANINHDETLSTLRYADRAKAIKTKAIINESPTDKLIRELREEIEALRKGGAVGGMALGMSDADKSSMERMREQLEQNEREMQRMKQTHEEKLINQRETADRMMAAESERVELKKTTPHIWNLNEDPVLTGMVVHFCHPMAKATTMGSAENQDINLAGVGLSPSHAVINNNDNKHITIKPVDGTVTVNGKEVAGEGQELLHNDRILLGSGHLYAFHHPQDAYRQQKENREVAKPSFNDAQIEIAKEKGFDMNSEGKSIEDLQLMDDLVEIIPMVNEVNAISLELDKKTYFEVILISPQARGEPHGKRTLVFVKVSNLVDQTEFYWIKNKFIDRKFNMQEMYQNFQFSPDDKTSWDVPQDEDPFYEDPEITKVIVGNLQIYLESIAYLVNMDDTLQISDYRGQNVGHCEVDLYPVDGKGKAIREAYVDSPKELLDKPLNFEVNIKNIKGLPKRFKNVYVEYKFEGSEFLSPKSKDVHTNFNIKFLNKFSWPGLTQRELNILQSGGIFTTVCANQRVNDQGQKDRKGQTTRWLVNDFRGIAQAGTPTTSPSNTKAIAAPVKSASSSGDSKTAAELVRLQKESLQVNSRLELIRKICSLAESQSKKTVPLDLVQKALRGTNIEIPAILPKDATEVEIKEVVRQVSGPAKSQSCAIM